MERFDCGTAVISGEGALAALKERQSKRLLVVTDSVQIQNGQARQVARASGCEQVEYYDAVEPEATMKQAVEGAGVLKQFVPDLVAAVGGRNVLDCAKAMVCFSRHDCILAAVPTAFGSGAEATDQVLLSHNHCRHLLQDDRMRPTLAVLEAGFVPALTKAEVGEGGFALLSASLEAYSAQSRGMITEIHAREAFSIAWGALPAAFSGNGAARQRLQTASVLAGMAWNAAGLGLCHAMENSLGCLLHLPRGRLAGMLLPAVIGCNAYACGHVYAALARTAGLGGSADSIGVRNLKNGLMRLRRQLGLPETLAQAGVAPQRIRGSMEKIVETTLTDPCCQTNPIKVEAFMVRRCLEEVMGRG